MRFELTKGALKHAAITLLLCSASLTAYKFGPIWFVPYLILMLCGTPYIWREEGDLNKRHRWNLKTWNSAEVILPLITCFAVALFVWFTGVV